MFTKLIPTDYILIPSNKIALLHKMTNDYFTDKWVKHDAVLIKTYQHKTEDLILLEFATKPDNEIFIFFFLSLSCEKAFYKNNFYGWFQLSDKIESNHKSPLFGSEKTNDKFERRTVLTSEMNGDFMVAYTEKEQKIEFYYTGEFKITNEKGYIKPNTSYTNFKKPTEIEFKPNIKKQTSLQRKAINHSQWNWKMILARLFLYPLCALLIWLSIYEFIPNGNYGFPLFILLFCGVYLSSDLYMIFNPNKTPKTK